MLSLISKWQLVDIALITAANEKCLTSSPFLMPLHSGLLLGPVLTSSSSDPASLMPSSSPHRWGGLCPTECLSSSPAGSVQILPLNRRLKQVQFQQHQGEGATAFLDLIHYEEWFASFVARGSCCFVLNLSRQHLGPPHQGCSAVSWFPAWTDAWGYSSSVQCFAWLCKTHWGFSWPQVSQGPADQSTGAQNANHPTQFGGACKSPEGVFCLLFRLLELPFHA